MSFIFNASDHARLAMLFKGRCESPDICPDPSRHGPYAGYRPAVHEAPNGDGNVDGDVDCECCHGTGVEP